ncbi:MAG: hypothetical protein Q7O66_18810 [Dehalococcoidia bacterium]|nr:hypothetical protein [Dehalococcoidia bacterium]
MAVQEEQVTIVGWPSDPAKVNHSLKVDGPCPVSISFEKTPANVIIQTTPKQPLYVALDMNMAARETIPVCIKLCEPIYAESDYQIGINILGKSWGAITLKGVTKLSNQSKGTFPTIEGVNPAIGNNVRPKSRKRG